MTKTKVEPYLFFGGRCEEALDHYTAALGAKVQMVMRYKDSPEPPPPNVLPSGFEDKVMHSSFQIGETVVMASDGCELDSTFRGFSLSLAYSSPEEATRAFNALASGGQVQMPLAKTFWAPLFGMVQDRFGVGWMITVPEPSNG
ncbi:MAG: VOC family protein [Bdellovibrionota bacterium]